MVSNLKYRKISIPLFAYNIIEILVLDILMVLQKIQYYMNIVQYHHDIIMLTSRLILFTGYEFFLHGVLYE